MSVHVLRCPNCGADLEVTDGSATIRCRYCKAHCRVEGVGAGTKLTPEQEAAWNGLIEEAKKIDLDALERDLEDLKQFHEEKQSRDLWEGLADNALSNEAELDALAQRWVSEGNGRKFLANMSTMASGEGVEHKAIRRVLDRLAAKVALLLTAQADEAATKQAALAERLDAVREEAERRAAQVEKRIAELNSPAELEKVRAAEELIARVEAEQQAAATSRTRLLASQYAAQQEADRNAALALRRQYRMSRVWAIVSFPIVVICVGVPGLWLAAWNPASWVMTVGRLLFFGSPFVALISSSMKWGKGTEAGRKFNEVAPLLGLPEVAVKSKSQQEASGCTHETAGGCGCVAIIALAVGLWAVDHFGLYFFGTNTQTPTNTPSPATNSEVKPPSNSAAPSNAPAGNTAPPANGK